MSNTGTVRVTAPVGRTVYLNGNYSPDFPKTAPHTFAVEYGPNTFETRDPTGKVDYRKTVTTNAGNPKCSIVLDPVSALLA